MTSKMEQASRERIARFLPDAIAKAIGSYDAFVQAPIEKTGNKTKANAFEEHHKACRVAVAHIELLLKLARLADLPDAEAAGNQIILSAVMQEAQDCLAEYMADARGDGDE